MPLAFLSRTNLVLKKVKFLPYQSSPVGSHTATPANIAGDKFIPRDDGVYSSLRKAAPSAECADEGRSALRGTTLKGSARINPFGIQMLSPNLRQQVFGKSAEPVIAESAYRTAVSLFEKHGLDISKSTLIPDVELKIPPLEGEDVLEHFRAIGDKQCGPYLTLIQNLCHELPPKPKTWLMRKGWTRYGCSSSPKSVPYPAEDALVFDIEVCKSVGEVPTLAVAVSPSAWYAWVSPTLISGGSQSRAERLTTDQLISLESEPSETGGGLSDRLRKPRIVVGHNVAYDRARVKEQYWLERTGTRFLDTMSLHISVGGVTSHQKSMLLKSKRMRDEHESSLDESAYDGDSDQVTSLRECTSLNSLSEVHALYCGSSLDKATRNVFVEGRIEDVRAQFQECMRYCASDVEGTHRVLSTLFPLFLERFPHPVTLAGMLEISMAYLPVNKNWERYLQDSKGTYDDLDKEAKFLLTRRADEACRMMHQDVYKKDLWMWSEDWSTNVLKLNKAVSKKPKAKAHVPEAVSDAPATILAELKKREEIYQTPVDMTKEIEELLTTKERLPARRPHLPGYPAWYRKLCEQPTSDDWSPGPQLITTKMQVTPKLLKLTWELYPLHYIRGHGWGSLRPADPKAKKVPLIEPSDVPFPAEELAAYWSSIPEKDRKFGGDLLVNEKCAFKKLPHKDGKDLRVGDPLARDFLTKITENILAGDEVAEQLLTIARKLSYWRNNRERILEQMVIWLRPDELPPSLQDAGLGAILPQLVVCGTLTRRAVERTWMTASNISSERVGSELRAVVQSPPGYSFIGADVDSQELWIASLIGDAKSVQMHGGTPFGWMTLSGSKADKTDMHSVTAKAVGISRDHAKVINYARIYGAGQAFAQQLIKQFNPQMSGKESLDKAKNMLSMTKGSRLYRLRSEYSHVAHPGLYSAHRAYYDASCQGVDVKEMFEPVWSGGMESAMFNQLEKIANSVQPRTPFLEGRLSRALEKDRDHNQTTRVNWVVQSGAVDFLHLLLVAFRWLEPQARFCLSFHDEVRYLVPDERKYQAALSLHVAHLLTRAFCAAKLGLADLPQSVAFFSSVEVDRALRKDASYECTTPSNPHGLSKGHGIPLGESLDIYQAIRKAGDRVSIQQDETHRPERYIFSTKWLFTRLPHINCIRLGSVRSI